MGPIKVPGTIIIVSKIFFDDNLNILIEDKHPIFKSECTDALKERCMIGFEKGCKKL